MDLMDFFMMPLTPPLRFIGFHFIHLSMPVTFCGGNQNNQVEDQTKKMDIIM